MDPQYKSLGYLLGANMEAIALIIAAKWGGDWLDAHYPIGLSWMFITGVVAFIAILHSWYYIFVLINKVESGQSDSQSEADQKKNKKTKRRP